MEQAAEKTGGAERRSRIKRQAAEQNKMGARQPPNYGREAGRRNGDSGRHRVVGDATDSRQHGSLGFADGGWEVLDSSTHGLEATRAAGLPPEVSSL